MIILSLILILIKINQVIGNENLTEVIHTFPTPNTLIFKDGFNNKMQLTNNVWKDYKWGKKEEQLIITIGDCHTESTINWTRMLDKVIYGWNNVPKNQDGTGKIYKPRNVSFVKTTCQEGMIKSYNENHPTEEYLGVAYLSYDLNNHITRVSTYMNERHIDRYSEDQWRQVLCHEIGHGFPLDHPDTTGKDTDSCMDYSRRLDNKYGNKYDVEVLDYLYGNGTLSKRDHNDYGAAIYTVIITFLAGVCAVSICYFCCKLTMQEEIREVNFQDVEEGEAGAPLGDVVYLN